MIEIKIEANQAKRETTQFWNFCGTIYLYIDDCHDYAFINECIVVYCV